jgi:hypothetical protein
MKLPTIYNVQLVAIIATLGGMLWVFLSITLQVNPNLDVALTDFSPAFQVRL